MNLKNIIKERWIFYLGGYLFGYMVQLLTDGIHGWQSLFPIKMIGIGCAIMLGNIFYHLTKKITLIQGKSKSAKYTIIILVVFLIIGLLRKLILASFGFDIAPLI